MQDDKIPEKPDNTATFPDTDTMKLFHKEFRKTLIPIVIILLIAALAFALMNKPKISDFSFTTINNQVVDTAALESKIILVNFWATDCPGCIAEMPALIETHKKYHDKGFEVIAVAMPYDPIEQVKAYSLKNQLPFIITHDDKGTAASQFEQVRVTPTTFILDKQRRIIGKVIGVLDFDSLHQLLDKQLAEGS
ncbi:MAG: TlpA disulfide reductase family protein [Methylophilaceae bacterium]